MTGGGPQCYVVQSCACIPDPKQKRRGGTWRDTTLVYIMMEQFHVLGGECKIGDHATPPSTCEIPENLYPKLSPKTLPPAETKPPTKPNVEPATRPPEPSAVQQVAPKCIQLQDPVLPPQTGGLDPLPDYYLHNPVLVKPGFGAGLTPQTPEPEAGAPPVEDPEPVETKPPAVEPQTEPATKPPKSEPLTKAPLADFEPATKPPQPDPVTKAPTQIEPTTKTTEIIVPEIEPAVVVEEEKEELMVVYHDKNSGAPLLVVEEAIEAPVLAVLDPEEEPPVVVNHDEDAVAPVSEVDPPPDTTKETTPEIAYDGQNTVAPMSHP